MPGSPLGLRGRPSAGVNIGRRSKVKVHSRLTVAGSGRSGACRARRARTLFTKEGNCFTNISDAAGLARIADTLSEPRAIWRLSQVCARWIYTRICFALDFDEQKRSGFRYQYSNYQIEYSRNLVFAVGAHMDQVFQAPTDRSRAPLDLKTIKTSSGIGTGRNIVAASDGRSNGKSRSLRRGVSAKCKRPSKPSILQTAA
jgi:hypothetical protein